MSIKHRYLLSMSLIMATALLLATLLLGHLEKIQMEKHINRHTELLASFAGASRDYVIQELRPALDARTHEFILQGKSSSYVTNGIFAQFNKIFPDYSYRQPAFHPLNPKNQASPFESDIILKFQDEPSLTTVSGFRKTDDQIFYYVAHPVFVEESCLTCHGDPKEAPPGLTENYGSTSGFHWPLGKVVSATIVQIPVEKEIAIQHDRHLLFAASVFFLLILFIGVHLLLFERLILRRMLQVTTAIQAMGDNVHATKQLPEETRDEFGSLVRAFNRMTNTMRDAYLEMERKVQERSIALRNKTEEQADANAAMKSLEQHNQLLLQSIGEGIYGVDMHERLTFINPVGASMLGWRVEELLGNHGHDLFHHTHPDGSPYPHTQCPVLSTLTDGHTRTLSDELFWRRDGSCFPVEYTSTPVLQDDLIVGAVVTFHDISTRVQELQHRTLEMITQKIKIAIYEVLLSPADLSIQLEEVLSEILAIPWLGNAPRGAILVPSPRNDDTVLVIQHGFNVEELPGIPLGKCLCGLDVPTHMTHHEDTMVGRSQQTDGNNPCDGHHLIIPLAIQVPFPGALVVYPTHGVPPFPPDMEGALLALGHALSRALQRNF
ncbi:MAG: DUF3365 domain-containing protein [Magnetococcales bacterium]|nr:DUF3365 domain-containing protein [Magnetococcales bacterium]